MSDFVLYVYPFPTRADRVEWTLKELDFSYTTKVVNPMQGEQKSAEYLALNPLAKVPTLLHDGQAYTESLAIMEYLNDLHPDRPLVPKDIQSLYQLRRALSYGMTEVEAYIWLMAQSTILKGAYEWQAGTADTAKVQLLRGLEQVYAQLANRSYLAGDSFSLADIYYYSLLRWCERMAKVALPEHVLAYLHSLEQRPKFYSR